MNDADLPDLWVFDPDLRFERIDGATPAWRTPGNGATRYVPAARLDALQAELEAARADAELLWANCRVIYFPDPAGSYPLEHNMRACGTKDSRADIEAALRIDAARKEQP